MLRKLSEAPLMTLCRLLTRISVLDISLIFFIYGVVGEVSVFRVFGGLWVVVGLTCKTSKSLVVHIDT
jgi:hypothetical protein